MFELPVIVQMNPDPSSPAIQHISQTYNISVTFKQRSRLYGATGVVRGSQNNVAAVKVITDFTDFYLLQNMERELVPIVRILFHR